MKPWEQSKLADRSLCDWFLSNLLLRGLDIINDGEGQLIPKLCVLVAFFIDAFEDILGPDANDCSS